MNFSFNAQFAKRYGLREAIVLQGIIWWVLNNKHKNKNKRNGKHWTYNSARAMSISFPFFLSNKSLEPWSAWKNKMHYR